MNIFATSSDPIACAVALDDKRLVKMVLETAQLLSTTLTEYSGPAPYKPTHLNHPCSVWTRESYDNYDWLMLHFAALLEEYTFRYGREHLCGTHFNTFDQFVFDTGVPSTPFANCTEFKYIADVHDAYRQQMIKKWNEDIVNKRNPRWTRRSRPVWAI